MQITADMIVLWGNKFEQKTIDQVPGIFGSLEDLAAGKGGITAPVLDLFADNAEVFQPVYDAYASHHEGMGPLTKPVEVKE